MYLAFHWLTDPSLMPENHRLAQELHWLTDPWLVSAPRWFQGLVPAKVPDSDLDPDLVPVPACYLSPAMEL